MMIVVRNVLDISFKERCDSCGKFQIHGEMGRMDEEGQIIWCVKCQEKYEIRNNNRIERNATKRT